MRGGLDTPEQRVGTGHGGRPGPRRVSEWAMAGGSLEVDGPVVVGVVNLTPDSFSDGGRFPTVEAALAHARSLKKEGAHVLDVGGESTRPGADPVPPGEEAGRVLPFIQEALGDGLGPLSIDTRNASVAREAMEAGAQIINDVSGLRHDPGMAEVAAGTGAGLILSHMRGTPSNMRNLADYRDLTSEITAELSWSVASAVAAGVLRDRIVVDPGIGFAKTAPQSLYILKNLAFLKALECPIMVGPSRKSFMDQASGVPPSGRTPGTIAACVMAYLGGARLFRVHDVAPIVQAMAVTRAILEAEE